MHLLAKALGTIAATSRGLSKVVLPRSLPGEFRHEMAQTVNENGGVAIIVGDLLDRGEITPQQAISFRTPEANGVSSVILITTEGFSKELKSLETFRDMLFQGLPGGVTGGGPAFLGLETICTEVSRQAIKMVSSSIQADRLASKILAVAEFLGRAYSKVGNDAAPWSSAYWQHLDMMMRALPISLKQVIADHPDAATHAAYMAAGLPRPSGPGAYRPANDPERYAKIIGQRWINIEEIERTLLDLEALEGTDLHPLRSLDWETLSSAKAIYGHPIIAITQQGRNGEQPIDWLRAWASTTEDRFFHEPQTENVAIEFFAENHSGEFMVPSVIATGSEMPIHVLPQPANKLDTDDNLEIAKIRIRGTLASAITPSHFDVELQVVPKSAARVSDLLVSHTATGFELEARLSRSFKAASNWNEKPITLVLAPKSIVHGSALKEKLKVQVLIPNPARPTVVVLERNGSRSKPKLQTHSNMRLTPNKESRLLELELRDGNAPEITLNGNRSELLLCCAGEHTGVSWIDGGALHAEESQQHDSTFAQYKITGQAPENPVLLVDGFEVSLSFPTHESGHVTPVVAAITGEPLVPADGEVLAELSTDPRFMLETWISNCCIREIPSDQFKASLGSVLLSTEPEWTSGDITWDQTIGAFSDLTSTVNARFPTGEVNAAAFDAFWSAFSELGLSSAIGQNEASALPSALDLRSVEKASVENYLEAFHALLETIDETRSGSTWMAYPFSAILFDPGSGSFAGMLLSPLHPIRLAWNWSAQTSSAQIASSELFGSTSNSFLRFIDGDGLPLVGPTIGYPENYLAASLSAGPEEFFSAWSLLMPVGFQQQNQKRSLELLGLQLPLGAPSGLDKGGMTSAIRDYLRVFPFTPQLRIGIASTNQRQRFAETDAAIVSAATELLSKSGNTLPGGVRILDSHYRTGQSPNASQVLRKLGSEHASSDADYPRPAFEWLRDDGKRSVDIRFLEDSPVHMRLSNPPTDKPQGGSTGPGLPLNRFRSWAPMHVSETRSNATNALSSQAFNALENFNLTLRRFESIATRGEPTLIEGELRMGHDLVGASARWTITGNRHLNPAAISTQLRKSAGGLMLWEWRPAFLSRSEQKGVRNPVSSSQPYTVLARMTDTLQRDISKTLEHCGIIGPTLQPTKLLDSLGVRGIGLASLLTMGHSQSMGAIGFYLAFKALEQWESAAGPDEVRCIIPMDAVYPLLDALAAGAKDVDDQKRADLLLLKATVRPDGTAEALVHPVEVKARSERGNSFPSRTGSELVDPIGQLKSTENVLAAFSANIRKVDGELQLVNSAVATLIEAALSLRPASVERKPSQEVDLLEASAAGKLFISETSGSLLWFQAGASGLGGAKYERRLGDSGHAGQFFSDFAAAAESRTGDEYSSFVLEVVESSMPKFGAPGTPSRSGEGPGPTRPVVPSPPVPPSSPDERVLPQTPIPAKPIDPLPEVADSGSVGIEILLGHEHRASQSLPVYFKPSETSLNQMNIGVVGDLGTGKTQFLKSLVYQMTRAGNANRGKAPKVFIFDYKHDYSDGEFPKSIGAKVLDPTRTLPLNFFALGKNANHVDRVRRANFFADMLRRISGIGQVQRQNLYESIMQAYQACPPGLFPLLHDIFDIYRDKTDGKADSVVSVLSLISDLMIFERDPTKVLDFNELFTGNTVLNLSSLGGAGQGIVDIIATMFLDLLYHDYMKNVPKAPFLTGPDGTSRRLVDSFILIDEAHHAMARGFDVLNKLMLEGREFGMGVILSSQYLSHFQLGGSDWAEPLSTWVVHNVRNTQPKDFQRIGFRGNLQEISAQVSTLQTHWAYYRCANGQNEGILMKGQPFYSLSKGTDT